MIPNDPKTALYRQLSSHLALFDFMQEAGLDGFWYASAVQPGWEWFNPRFLQLLGYDPHKSSLSWKSLAHPDDVANLLELLTAGEAVHRSWSDGNIFEGTVRYMHQKGFLITTHCQVRLVDTEEGPCLLAAHTLISKPIKSPTPRIAHWLQALHENQSMFILTIDKKGNYRYVNDYYLNFFKWPNKELIGTSSAFGVIEADLPKLMAVGETCFSRPWKKAHYELSSRENLVLSIEFVLSFDYQCFMLKV